MTKRKAPEEKAIPGIPSKKRRPRGRLRAPHQARTYHELSKFGRWMADHGITAIDAAEELGISRQYVYQIRNGEHPPSAALRLRIDDWTNGEVSFRDWKEL